MFTLGASGLVAQPFEFDETIDIGPYGQQVQAGAIAFTGPAANTNNTDFTGPLVIGGNAVTLTIDDTNIAGADQGGIDWRDRGNAAASPLVQIGEDFVKNNSGIVRLTFSGLPAGDYIATGYHADPDNSQSGNIQVFVDNGNGMGFLNLTDTAGNSNFAAGGVGGLTTAEVEGSASMFSFITDGINPLAIVFDGSGFSDTETPLNGLRLQLLAVPEPGSIAIWTLLGFVGLFFGWQRMRRRSK